MKIPVTELDIIFISYDEPNANANFADLQSKCPWAKRSHGVFGSDAAHKAAAELSETDRFVGVDADNIVNPDFFGIEIDTDKIEDDWVISWSGKNDVNGLVYGNGGLKCWPKQVVKNMRTHEASNILGSPKSLIEFCWDIHYVQMNNVYSNVHNNATPYQAYRAGFREGVKMSLDEGAVLKDKPFTMLHEKNLKRLLVWMTVGADALNGWWAIYGARLGCWMTNATDWDYTLVRDFKWHTEFWETEVWPKFENDIGHKKLLEEVFELGNKIRDDLELPIAEMDVQNSKFFKEVYVCPTRTAPLIREDQIEYEVFK